MQYFSLPAPGILRQLEPKEKRTFLLHLFYALLDGLSLGIIALNEFVILRTVGANTFEVSLLFQIATLMLPFSIFMVHVIAAVKDKQRMLRVLAFVSRAPLLLFMFFPAFVRTHPHQQFFVLAYLVIFQLYYLANPFILPVLNLFTRAGYGPKRFGKLFGLAMSLTQLLTLGATLAFGFILDVQPDNYRYVFPVLGIMGISGIFLISYMPAASQQQGDKGLRAAILAVPYKRIFRESLEILRKNRAFAQFQMAMMCYGTGFLMSQAIITVYLAKYFQLSYPEIAFYKNISLLVAIFSYPYFGRHLDRKDPRILAAMCYGFNLLFYLFLLLGKAWSQEVSVMGHRLVHFIFAAFLIQGLFASSMGMVWGIGSSYFAPAEEAARYHSIHLSLTGIRGILAPPIGVIVFKLSGYYGSFGCAIGMQLLAMTIMYLSLKRRPLF
jgi:hypothetical protein